MVWQKLNKGKGERQKMHRYIANTYEIISRIGSGNSGIVYKARHMNLDKYVVLKKIKTDKYIGMMW